MIGSIFLLGLNIRCEKEDISQDLPTCECVKEVWLKSNPLRVRGYQSEVLLLSTPVECQEEVEQEIIEVSLEGTRYFKIVCDLDKTVSKNFVSS